MIITTMVHSKKHQQRLAEENRKKQDPTIIKNNDDWPKRRYTGLVKISQPGAGVVAGVDHLEDGLEERYYDGEVDYPRYKETKEIINRFRNLNITAVRRLSTKDKRDYELYQKLKEKTFADWFDDPNIPLAIKEDVLRLFRILEGHIQGRSREILHFVCAELACDFHEWPFDHKIIWKNFDPYRYYENLETIWNIIQRRGLTVYHSVTGRKVTLRNPA